MMSECDACLYIDSGYDPPDFYNIKMVKARKPHACCECRRTIAKGEEYERASGRWDRVVSTFHTCTECQDIATSLACDGGRMHGGLWEAMEDMRDAIGFGCLAKLTRASSKETLQQWLNDR
jgi:hypothetical protein